MLLTVNSFSLVFSSSSKLSSSLIEQSTSIERPDTSERREKREMLKNAKNNPLNPSNAEATSFHPKHNDAKISENHPNPVMLVFIGKLLQSALI